MEQKTKITIDSIQSNGCLSVLKTTYIDYNGQEIVLENHREALTPIMNDRAKEVLSDDLYAVVKTLWTDEKIKAYKEKSEKYKLY